MGAERRLRPARPQAGGTGCAALAQEMLYDGDRDAFEDDVEGAHWAAMTWEIGPVTDLDVSWGVHVRVDEATVPPFLTNRGLAARWEGSGIVLHVQTPDGEPYQVAGQGLDLGR